MFIFDQTKHLFVASTLFFIGLCGVFLNRKNIVILIMSVEIIFLSVNINFIFFSVFIDCIFGQIFSLMVLTTIAAESVIGLAILVMYFRVRGTIKIDFINLIKG
jgi:NADH-quinone oxidoreductase subunit K